ncbi:hypothetical protein N9L18_01290 [Candidatus Pacebacteria bacterium]|nr:hypothetical protein [Candidatus Paceibacterota bacterium]
MSNNPETNESPEEELGRVSAMLDTTEEHERSEAATAERIAESKKIFRCVCLFCGKPFNVDKSFYTNGHQKCAEAYEAKWEEDWTRNFLSLFPPEVVTFDPC